MPESRLKRSEFLEALSLAKPAVGRALFVPILSHYCLTGDALYAYDDSIAIVINTPTLVRCAVPADLIVRLLTSMSGEEMSLVLEGAELRVSCGRSKVKLPTLPESAFIYTPQASGARVHTSVEVTEDMLQGLSQCLVSVGVDQTHPAQMGITWDRAGRRAMLYSTDNVTMSRYALKDADACPDDAVILPTAFCRELISLCNKVPEGTPPAVLSVYDHHVEAVLGDWARVFGKVVTNETPLAFEETFQRMMPGKALRVSIPDAWESMFSRAAAVVDPSAPRSRMDVEDGVLTVETKSRLGEVRDVASVRNAPDKSPFYVDPVHVLRACKHTKTFGCYPDALVLESGEYTHLISHCSE